MSTTGLSDNIYVAFILSALVELPAYFACIILMDHWGRKPTLCLVLFIAGVFCIPAGYASGTLQTVLVLIGNMLYLLYIYQTCKLWVFWIVHQFQLKSFITGKFGCSGAFCIIYVFTAEIYPTAVRTTGLGLCSMVARIGSIAAPQVLKYIDWQSFLDT